MELILQSGSVGAGGSPTRACRSSTGNGVPCRKTMIALRTVCVPPLPSLFSSWAFPTRSSPFQGESIHAIRILDLKAKLAAAARCCGLLAEPLFIDARPPASPIPRSYWDVKDIRPGMKGVGQTVMVGTKLEEFEAEVLGVMRDVSPGRDMVLCRLKGCNLEHAGIIQGMSGSPIYIDGKLLGAVAFAWEFAKDPIAGVTPFSADVSVRPVERPADRRRVEGRVPAADSSAAAVPVPLLIEGLADDEPRTGQLAAADRRSPVGRWAG